MELNSGKFEKNNIFLPLLNVPNLLIYDQAVLLSSFTDRPVHMYVYYLLSCRELKRKTVSLRKYTAPNLCATAER
jgi:hypothetical protein